MLEHNWLRFLQLGLLASVLGGMVSCAQTPLGQGIEGALKTDPQLQSQGQPSAQTSSGFPSPAPSPGQAQTVASSPQVSNLDQAPAELRPYLDDLVALGLLTQRADSEITPNQAIARRDYARWLLNAHNRIYAANRSAEQIHLGLATAPGAFEDVPRSDPDFALIQGLAEAGIVPSPLSGTSVVLFKPDAPLRREDLLLWKVPLDVRKTLPTADVKAIQQDWGFQDANKITPAAQRAVMADFQNGDRSNIRRAFGYTTLFQPQKPVTAAEAAATLWYFGLQNDGISARDVLQSSTSKPASQPQPQ